MAQNKSMSKKLAFGNTKLKKNISNFAMYFCKIKSVSATKPRAIPYVLLIKTLEKRLK